MVGKKKTLLNVVHMASAILALVTSESDPLERRACVCDFEDGTFPVVTNPLIKQIGIILVSYSLRALSSH